MSGYTKLFQKILNSSIWDEDDKTRIVWITMLAMSNKDGEILSTVSSLARNARVSKEDCRTALAKFCAPDPESTTPDYEGRRIAAIEGGWKLLNHRKYRDMMGIEERREYYRMKKTEYRDRERALRKGMTAREIVKENAQVRAVTELREQPPEYTAIASGCPTQSRETVLTQEPVPAV